MIHCELTNNDNIDVINKNYGRFDLNTTRTFYKGSEVIGFADYFIINNTLYLKNLRVTKIRNKYGSLIVHFLFDTLNIKEIYGYSINNVTDCFWKSLGANFSPSLLKGGFILNRDIIDIKFY